VAWNNVRAIADEEKVRASLIHENTRDVESSFFAGENGPSIPCVRVASANFSGSLRENIARNESVDDSGPESPADKIFSSDQQIDPAACGFRRRRLQMTSLNHSNLLAAKLNHEDVDALFAVDSGYVVLFEFRFVLRRLPPSRDMRFAKPRSQQGQILFAHATEAQPGSVYTI